MNRSDTRPVTLINDERVAAYLSEALRPIPLLAGLTAGGLAVIYLMGLLRLLEPVGWQMLATALMILVIAVTHRTVISVAERGRGMFAFGLHSAITTIAAVVLSLLWEGITPVAIIAAWAAPAITFPARLPRRQYLVAVGASALATAVVLALAWRPILPRMAANTTGSFAAMLLVASVFILFMLLVLADRVLRFRTLQARLTGTIVPIIAIPILFTSAIAAYNSLTSSAQQFRNSLEAVSSLKRGQLNAISQSIFADLSSIQEGSQEAPNIMHVLQRPGASDEDYRLNASLAASQLRNVIVMHPTNDYEEVLVIDAEGNVALSTYLLNQGVSFGDQEFFRQGMVEPTVRFMRYPGNQNAAGEFRLVGAAPFHGETPDQVLGVVVAVAQPDAVLSLLAPASGLENLTTYLVDTNLNAVTVDPAERRSISAGAIADIVSARTGAGSGTYRNYAGTPVLGYYVWDPALQAVVVTEVPQTVVFARSLAAVLVSALVGIITIVIAAIAVLAASRAISEPVTDLASAAGQLAAGSLSARARTGRRDEIGRLAEAFNSMAGQMQSMIAGLEQRVADRTRLLELQTLRLRTAAEVARDAALAPTLDELLERTSTLVLERFGVQEAAIYLLDEKRQYAVLQAAPTEEGKRMMAGNYRVAVGARSAVGQAADIGDAQLVLRGRGSPYEPGDEFHPATQSQLTLPLRTNEGTIGLLDLQSSTEDFFTLADAATIQVLADQVAAAIERSRLLLQVQQQLGALEQSYRRFSESSWSAYSQPGARPLGYRYDNVKLEQVATIPADAQEALRNGAAVATSARQGSDGGSQAYLPIKLRGQTLGVISVGFHEAQPSPKTLALLEQAVERLGTALENVRLLEDSLRRASKERTISEITSRIGTSISVRNVLQTAVEELGRALPGTDVSISFRPQGTQAAKERQT